MFLSSTYCLNGTVIINFVVVVFILLLLTELFISSGIFLVFIMAGEFFWHTQQRSDIGFITTICGVKSHQYFRKVVYAASRSPASALDIAYCPIPSKEGMYVYYIYDYGFENSWLTFLVVLDGNNWTSNF